MSDTDARGRTGGSLANVEALADGVVAGDRAMLARAITLVESQRADHQALAQELLARLLPETGRAHRVGITGVPGVGKSTTIDQLGCNLIAAGHRVAVLAVDPTSKRSGGSILGDKTRMARLSMSPSAFIRPSPTSGTLGGVARKTRETMALVEAAGFDVIIVETVGVGQSEVAVAEMVDVFLVLLLPGGGDELQGIKKGIIELADILAINKADGDARAGADRTAADYQGALNLLTPHDAGWQPPVLTISARENRGLDQLWSEVERHRAIMTRSGALGERRAAQAVAWLEDLLAAQMMARLGARTGVAEARAHAVGEVRAGRLAPTHGAEAILAAMGLGDTS